MRVLMVHCRYLIRGGEDECYEAEQRLLREAGVEVDGFEDDNRRVKQRGGLRTALATVWSATVYREVRARLRAKRYDLVHVHNYFPLISPAVYHAAQAEGCAVVQTLHNYRLSCPSGIFYRDGHVCEDCLGKAVPWPGVLHACYRSSRAGTAAVAAMLAGHRLIGTWRRQVDLYIALNEFMRQKAIAGGIPASKIAIKPNFVSHDPGIGDGAGGFALFAARLNREKGVPELLRATVGLPRVIVGDGPLRDGVPEAVGFVAPTALGAFYERAAVVVCPSRREGYGVVAREAMAHGRPVVATAVGGLRDAVDERVTGLLVPPGDAVALRGAIEHLLGDAKLRKRLGAAAREKVRAELSWEAATEATIDAYSEVLSRA